MHWVKQLKQYHHENPLAVRLLAYILLCSSLITMVSTASQLYLDYRNDLSLINERIEQMEATSLDELSNQVWLINDQRINAQLNALFQLPVLQYLSLHTQLGDHFQAGTPPEPDKPVMTRQYQLEHTTPEGVIYPLGTLKIYVDLTRVYNNLTDKVLLIFATQAVKTFLVSIFILYIIWRLVTRHLGALSRYARELTPNNLDLPLALDRTTTSDDELSEVVSALNSMRQSLKQDISHRKQVEQQLAILNERLEARVELRTKELLQTNQALTRTVNKLRSTQSQLVESEKMAALGNLVAGVAHEINTPIGIGLTAASFLEDRAHAEARLHPTDFTALAIESSSLITSNLKRAAQLVHAFKQVSADQSSEQPRQFYVAEYLQEILLSMAPRLKQCHPEIMLNCPPQLTLFSYPGALYQIIVNLIQNSLIHGFAEKSGGKIWIQVTSSDKQLQIDYSDNGCGIDETVRPRVFEPFFTTRRHAGSTGLGLHIAYNLSTQRLNGNLSCQPPKQGQRGAQFLLTINRETE